MINTLGFMRIRLVVYLRCSSAIAINAIYVIAAELVILDQLICQRATSFQISHRLPQSYVKIMTCAQQSGYDCATTMFHNVGSACLQIHWYQMTLTAAG